MEDKKTYYTEDLIESAIEDFKEQLKYYKENEQDYYDDGDLINEIADNNIPIYTYDLLQYASNNFDLIQENELAGDNPDVIKIIQSNMYEILTEELYNYINEKEKEDE